MYQVGDSIERNGSSFNVENTGLDGLVRSSEEVASWGFLGVRLRHITDGFGETITNKHHIFHIGAGYVFGN